MLISCILPRLVAALLRRATRSSSPQPSTFPPSPSSNFYLQQAPYYFPSTSPPPPLIPQAPSASIWRVDSLGSLVTAGNNIVPLLNLLLGLVVFFVLVDDRADNLLTNWFTSTSSLTVALSSYQPHSGDIKSPCSAVLSISQLDEKVHSLAVPTQPQKRSRKAISIFEEALLLTIIVSVMLSMIFVSNSVFDNFAMHLPPAIDLTLLFPLASHFASFTLLVLFLLSSLLFILLSSLLTTCTSTKATDQEHLQQVLPLNSLVSIMSLVLLASTGLSRFPLAIVTLLRPSFSTNNFDLPHVALLVLEPGALLLMGVWVAWRSKMELEVMELNLEREGTESIAFGGEELV